MSILIEKWSVQRLFIQKEMHCPACSALLYHIAWVN